MTVEQFIEELEQSVASLPYIENVQIIPMSESTMDRRVLFLRYSYRLFVSFDELEFHLSFALIAKEEGRVWGLDRDYRHNWHIHPLNNIKEHQPTPPKSVKQIVAIFDKAYRQIIFQRFGQVLFGWLL